MLGAGGGGFGDDDDTQKGGGMGYVNKDCECYVASSVCISFGIFVVVSGGLVDRSCAQTHSRYSN